MKTIKNILDFCIEKQKCSTSMLMDEFQMGYNMAGAWIDYLEGVGFLSPFHGSKERTVLVQHYRQIRFDTNEKMGIQQKLF